MHKRTITLVLVLVFIAASIVYLESQKAHSLFASTAVPSGSNAITGSSDIAQASRKPSTDMVGDGNDVSGTSTVSATPSAEDLERVAKKEQRYTRAPELAGISGYINTQKGMTLSDFKGNVILVDFWTYSCINCIRTLPYLIAWDEKYREQGLIIIGVHTPEFTFEKDYNNVLQAVQEKNILYPVVMDNDYATWRAYKNRYWPRKYLVDSDGFIRYDHIGEGAYEETERVIIELLEERGSLTREANSRLAASSVNEHTTLWPQTPELYAGYDFALPRKQNIGNAGGLQPELAKTYILPQPLPTDTIVLEGTWKSLPDALLSEDPIIASIHLNFIATQVHIVAMSMRDVTEMEVRIDGRYLTPEEAGTDVRIDTAGRSTIAIREPRLYTIYDGPHGRHTLTLTVRSTDFSFSAFTFG